MSDPYITTPYVTVQQVKNCMRSSYSGTDDTLLINQLIPACSAFLDNYCNVPQYSFLTTPLDELYHGTGDQLMFLNARPIQSISRIATTQLPAISVHNTDPDNGTRANISLTSTAVVLTYIKAAVTTTTTLLLATYPTVTALANAINSAGNFWTAQVSGGFGNWSSSDLRATQGAFGSRIGTSYLWIHWQELSWYRVNELNGEIYSPAAFSRGVYNWRCTYIAGYTSFPDDLAQALCELVVQTYYAREQNANMQTENMTDYSYTRLASKKSFDGLSEVARRTIGMYKRRPVQKFSTW